MDGHWSMCGLCGKTIKHGEECFYIKYQDQNRYSNNYRSDYWHLKHFKLKDYSKKCKVKLECVTSNKMSKELGCRLKICSFYKG